MFTVGYGETVGSVKLLTGAEIDVSVLGWIKDCIQTGLRRHIDRSRRKSYMLVGIVWRIHGKMLLEDSVQSIVEAEGNGRVCLKLHLLIVTVKVDTGDYRILEILESLTADDGCHDRNLHPTETLCLGLGIAFRSPESVILLLETVEDILYRCRPVHLICIRQNQRKDIFRSETVAFQEVC